MFIYSEWNIHKILVSKKIGKYLHLHDLLDDNLTQTLVSKELKLFKNWAYENFQKRIGRS